MGKKGRPSKAQVSANLELKEAEIKKQEELNRREQRALDEKAELIRRKRALDEAEGGEELAEEPMNPFANLDPGFVEALDSLSSEGRMMIYKEDRTGLSKVAEYPVLDAESMERQLENVAHEHGGGSFMVRLLGPNGKIARQKSFKFDPKAYAKEEKPSDGGGNMQAMMNFLIESRKESADLLRTFILAQSRQPVAPGLDLEKLLSLGLLKDKSPADMKGMMELFTTALTWGRELAEGKNPGENGGGESVLKDLVQPFLSVLGQIQAKNPPSRPALPTRPMATPKPLPDGETSPEQLSEAPAVDPSILKVKSNFFYKMYVPTIIKAAVDKAAPSEVAADILDTVPETHHGMVRKFAAMPDVVDFVSAFEPVAREHAEWVKAVAAEILAAFEEDGGEESPDGLSPNGHEVAPPPDSVLKAG